MTLRPTNIIECEHERAFTVVANELLNDGRISLDEKGLLCWFLSLPKDWQIIPAHVCKTHKIGRDKYHRIMKSLRSNGYARMKIERAEDGTIVCIRHIITERPRPQGDVLSQTDERVCEIENAEIEAIDDDVASLQQPGLPDRDEPSRANPPPNKILKDSLNPESTKAEGVDWPDLQKAWPFDDILSPLICEKLFASLSRWNRKRAVEAARPYLANCRAKNRKICDLSTYLKERRFERAEVSSDGSLSQTKPGSPQAARWLESGQLSAFQVEQLARGRTITTATEWPQLKQSTGPPPSSLMSPEDEEELQKWG